VQWEYSPEIVGEQLSQLASWLCREIVGRHRAPQSRFQVFPSEFLERFQAQNLSAFGDYGLIVDACLV
jgi:hypothetical protein